MLQLLADRLVELKIVDTISLDTVEQTLKNVIQPHAKKQCVIPPDENGNFVAAMEDVLEVYQQPIDPTHPVICMDEQLIQLHGEVREAIPAQSGAEHHNLN
ncbi:hypothetical protein FGU65_02855 [Methanoculleus sp. FWC-SCC1]|uniref:Transposase n=1 Tax=Methanoculleus frigidifontis TaxID=2584085 RepID=A0ABT8M7D4_9EURY|nr:hypothetical protein [Methanoculleus sp. FWC-SCC1]